ncbi:MAG TPA: ribosome maturation factor RimM [Chitinophagales bacterium]|nr:ribosome maturation factor RimM [Chitinophagales bacterium]
MKDLIQVGSIHKAHGVKGIMKVRVKPDYMEDLLQVEAVFIETPKETLPHFIKSIEKIADDVVLLLLEDFDSKEQITPMSKYPILLREEDLTEIFEEYESLVGYTVIDNAIGKIGEIKEVIEMPSYELVKVVYQNRIVMIPMHEDLVEDVDEEEKKITMNLPEGFFEIF